MVHGSIDYNLEHLTRCHLVFFWSFCIIFCSFHNIIIHPEPFFAKKFGFFLLLCYRLGKQKQLLASGVANGVDSCTCNGIGFRRFMNKRGTYGIKSRCFAGFVSRKLSIKTQVVCDYAIGPTLVHKNMAAIPCNA